MKTSAKIQKKNSERNFHARNYLAKTDTHYIDILQRVNQQMFDFGNYAVSWG